MNAKELKQRVDDRAKVNAWLDHIEEHDKDCRAEVLAQCKEDSSARAYYVQRYNEDCK